MGLERPITPMQDLSTQYYALIKALFLNLFGLVLPKTIPPVAKTRSLQFFNEHGVTDLARTISRWQETKATSAFQPLTDIFTVNHTSFFRENAHFTYLSQTALPAIAPVQLPRPDRQLRMWSAAAASGEEAFSLLFAAHQYYGDPFWEMQAGVLATDISSEMLRKGYSGQFQNERLQKIAPQILQSYTHKQGEDRFQFIKKVREKILFRWFNLASAKFPFKQRFHIIFCRNVILYFSEASRVTLLENIFNALEPGGFLFIGLSEVNIKMPKGLQQVAPAVFRKHPDLP